MLPMQAFKNLAELGIPTW